MILAFHAGIMSVYRRMVCNSLPQLWKAGGEQKSCKEQSNAVEPFQQAMCSHAIGVQTGPQFLTLQQSPLVRAVLALVEKRNWMPCH